MPTNESLYEYIIKNKAGDTLASLQGVTNRKYSKVLNKTGDASFSCTITDPILTQDLLLLGNKELYIYRASELVWGGELVTRRATLADGRETLTVNAKGFLDLLSKRLAGTSALPRVFSSTQGADIAWTLINESQALTNGDFGITRGSHPTTTTHDRTYEYKDIKGAIEGLSNLEIDNGFDFELGANKELNIWYPQRGITKQDIVFEYGVNMTSLDESIDASNMANKVIVLGSGLGSDMLTSTVNSTSTIQESYKIREKTLSKKEIITTETLTRYGNQELDLRQLQQQVISITVKGGAYPVLGSYDLGDTVRVICKRGIVQIDGYYRIYGIQVNISDEDDEDVVITLSNK